MQPASHSTKALKDLCEQALAQAAALADLLAQLESYRQQPDFARSNLQIVEVSAAIAKLEKKQVPVPRDLRRLKTELLAQADNDQMVVQTFATVTKSLARHAAFHQTFKKPNDIGADGASRRKSSATTPFKVLRSHLLEVLQELGGSAAARDVLDSIESKLQTVFLPGDLQPDTQGVTNWRKSVCMERQHLVKKGVLRSDSPRGIWQLATRPR
jgi:hypothetical protein